ncbi:MAG: hypothetical protein ABL936_13120, partial [Aestuariivirga sp.]
PVPSMATSKARGPIRANIFDAIAWLDLAFYQTMENHVDKAKRSMLVAMQLAPDNRFVLRCASRFFLHLNDPDRARDILIRSEGIKTDPWLMAAEISMSTIAGKGPKSAKGGTNLIEDGKFGHRHTTELAGALATLEIGGNRKKMRRLFQHSMKEPTGNSLAQAAWATPVVGMELVPPGFQVAGEHEAPAHLLFNEGKFDDSFVNSKLWVQDEPFATRPFEFTAATAGIVENFEEAIRYADDGFKLSPKSNRLMISKSFALACTGHTAEASQLISQIDRKIEKGVFGYFANANEGLIAFREGRLDDAKTLYHNAVRGFRLIDDLSYAAIAQSYMAREAFRAGDPEADNLLKQAKESVEKASKSKLALHSLNLALVDRGIAKTETTKEPEKLVWTTPNFSGLIETTPEQSEIHLKLTNN